tara:strand:+ start:138 stop:260 length:123 start_codon:yes stop_codon:yes gene_type:complete
MVLVHQTSEQFCWKGVTGTIPARIGDGLEAVVVDMRIKWR